jgi:hypothetical protein
VTVPALLVYGERDGNVPVAASVKRIDQALIKAGNRITRCLCFRVRRTS